MSTSTVKIGEKAYEFDFGNPNNRECMLIERIFDGTFKEWSIAVKDGSITALTCLVYVLEKRENPAVRFEDVDFAIGDFDIEDDEEQPAEGEGGDVPKEPEAEPAPASTDTAPADLPTSGGST